MSLEQLPRVHGIHDAFTLPCRCPVLVENACKRSTSCYACSRVAALSCWAGVCCRDWCCAPSARVRRRYHTLEGHTLPLTHQDPCALAWLCLLVHHEAWMARQGTAPSQAMTPRTPRA